jgi:hypothetical protein
MDTGLAPTPNLEKIGRVKMMPGNSHTDTQIKTHFMPSCKLRERGAYNPFTH